MTARDRYADLVINRLKRRDYAALFEALWEYLCALAEEHRGNVMYINSRKLFGVRNVRLTHVDASLLYHALAEACRLWRCPCEQVAPRMFVFRRCPCR